MYSAEQIDNTRKVLTWLKNKAPGLPKAQRDVDFSAADISEGKTSQTSYLVEERIARRFVISVLDIFKNQPADKCQGEIIKLMKRICLKPNIVGNVSWHVTKDVISALNLTPRENQVNESDIKVKEYAAKYGAKHQSMTLRVDVMRDYLVRQALEDGKTPLEAEEAANEFIYRGGKGNEHSSYLTPAGVELMNLPEGQKYWGPDANIAENKQKKDKMPVKLRFSTTQTDADAVKKLILEAASLGLAQKTFRQYGRG